MHYIFGFLLDQLLALIHIISIISIKSFKLKYVYNAHNCYNRTYTLHSLLQCAFKLLQPHRPSLHIAGPAQSPRLDKPHPATVP